MEQRIVQLVGDSKFFNDMETNPILLRLNTVYITIMQDMFNLDKRFKDVTWTIKLDMVRFDRSSIFLIWIWIRLKRLGPKFNTCICRILKVFFFLLFLHFFLKYYKFNIFNMIFPFLVKLASFYPIWGGVGCKL